MAMALSKNTFDSDDVVQDTFIKLWDSAKSIQQANRLRYWLRRVLTNKIQDLWRKKKFEPMADNYVDTASLPDSEDISDKKILLNAIQQLNENHQMIVRLYYFEGLKIREIAETIGKAESTIKTHLHRAITYLGEIIKKEEQNELS